MLTSTAAGPAGSAPPGVPGASFLAAHSLGWASRMLGIYLGSAAAAMLLGTGALYVAHLVQPPDRWPDFRPLPGHARNLPGPAGQSVRSRPPARPADLISDATPGPQDLVQSQDAGSRLAAIPGIVAEAPGAHERERLLAAIRDAASRATPGKTGPLTVFLPSGDIRPDEGAPSGDAAALSPQEWSRLRDMMARHVVAGGYTMESLQAAARTAGGTVSLKTLGGTHLHIIPFGSDRVIVRDDQGLAVAMAPASREPGDGMHVFDQLGSVTEAGAR